MDKKNYLVIGDLHQDSLVLKDIVTQFPHHQYVFLGDLVDSFYSSLEQGVEVVETVLGLCEQGHTLIMGNHEASYFHPPLQASGWNGPMNLYLRTQEPRMFQHMKSAVWFPQWRLLISHAGLTHQIWKMWGVTLKNLSEKLEQWFQDLHSPYYWIGRYRGGQEQIGGLLWCDFFTEFQAVPTLNQIVGHTQIEQVRIVKGEESINYNIDVLQGGFREVLEIERDTGKITRIKLC